MSVKSIQAIVVDDEAWGIINLQYYLNKLCPLIEIVATGQDLNECMVKAGEKKIDLAFLDIEIFDQTIFELLKQAGDVEFKIIFVSAYEQYALKAIKTEAVDYILKPFIEEDIKSCYEKILKIWSVGKIENEKNIAPSPQTPKKIIFKDMEKIYIVSADDIYYMEGRGAYSEITFKAKDIVKTILVSKVLNKIEQEYVYDLFARVHKSYIINLNKIDNVISSDGYAVKMKNNVIIPVAKRRVNDFLALLKHISEK